MGATRDDFVKFPRTPHLFGSHGTDDDKRLSRAESLAFIAAPSLIVEEKLDGTNVGIHFTRAGRMVLQCRGHEITDGMHPQYDLFKQWTAAKRPMLETVLGDRFILYGECLYARHSIHYRALPHYFFEFDLYDKDAAQFLDLATRLRMLQSTSLHSAPVLHRGAVSEKQLHALIGPSAFDSAFDNPLTGGTDNLMEGLYLRTEDAGFVTGRAKSVRPEFVEKVRRSEDWRRQAVVPNRLVEGADIWG
ncbi:MAG: RNA ligase family protein [Verrucomicrobia bacterium]|nr:RNA ligase family protein [Verrucomicrobiota bacterium]